MEDTIQIFQNISKIEIESLWGRFDLTWRLNPDVNILSGINGSGKSTILDCIAGLISQGTLPSYQKNLIKKATITFNDEKFIVFQYLKIKDTIKNIEVRAKKEPMFMVALTKVKEQEGDNYKNLRTKAVQFEMGITSFDNMQINLEELHNIIKIDIVSTFDNPILEAGNRPEESVKTELDRDIFRLQKSYLDYQLNIGKKAFEIVAKNDNGSNTQEEVFKIKKTQERFLEIIDNLFGETGKKINRNKNELTFTIGKDELTPYQLSSGEKQILVILLTVLVQNNQPAIIFMDEPEISLHFDWQKKIIQFIRELNPNIQIILATHSPAVIMEGWSDKVSEVRDLITLDRQALKS